jgi:hypothetical protein
LLSRESRAYGGMAMTAVEVCAIPAHMPMMHGQIVVLPPRDGDTP